MTSLHWEEAPSKKVPASYVSKQQTNPWFGVAMILIGVMIGFGIGRWRQGTFSVAALNPSVPTPTAAQAPQAPSQPETAQNLPPIDSQKDHIRGDLGKATVAVIEYSDFECPFCKRHHPTMTQIMDTYKDDVVWIYRHFPLAFHANAQKEAEASECANELGGNDIFWQYTDTIFERTTTGGTGFPLENLVTLAKELGLNEDAFKTCLDTGKYAQHVQDDMSGGSAAGVNGTPGNIVMNLKTEENRIVSGAQPFSAFKSVIDSLLSVKPVAAVDAASEKTIKMTAELWKFTPNVIRVKQDEKVVLEITAVSGTHGLAVPELGINETIIQGNTVSVNIPTDKIGTFDFRCSVQCGSGHDDMKGQIIIES